MNFSVQILGSSSALPTSKRNPSACILNVYERLFLIDCGEGTQIQLRKNRIKLGKINHIFISHLHGDHTYGLFGLLSTFNLLGRKNDLHIYAHEEIENILNDHFKYFDPKRGFKIIYHHLNYKNQEIIFENKDLLIKSFPLIHRIPCFGFVFNEKQRPNNIKKDKIEQYNISIKQINEIKNGADLISDTGEIIKNSELTTPSNTPRSFSYCSDTLYNESIIPFISNVDLLVHEATFIQTEKKRAKETFHSTARDAAKIADKANVNTLLLTHFSSRYKNLDVFYTEATSKFKNTILANDGLKINISTKHILSLENKNF